jgi:two-component system response regulator YesN
MIEVLLVDDEAFLIESLTQTIPWDQIGVKAVYKAYSGMEALRILEEQSIDIVVTDIRMPEMSGLELISVIQKRWDHIKCILLSGFADFEYAKKALQLNAFDYLLKPINDDEFILTLTMGMESLKDDWEQVNKYQSLLSSRETDLSDLRTKLMHDLLLGRRLSKGSLNDKLIAYNIPLQIEDATVIILLRLGTGFTQYDIPSLSLMEYAVGNIGEEAFANSFQIWQCKGPHEDLVIFVKLKDELMNTIACHSDFEQVRHSMLRQAAEELINNVSHYLKGEVLVKISKWFDFPDGISQAYRSALIAFYYTQSSEKGSVEFITGIADQKAVQSTVSLYKPPTLIHLLESNQWEAVETKINSIFDEMEAKSLSIEHNYEVFFAISNSFAYMAHKQGQLLSEITGTTMDSLFDRSLFLSSAKLKEWTWLLFDKLKAELSHKLQQSKGFIIKQVQELVSQKLDQDVSVKIIAEHVYLHPVYLSKIFKLETGESLGDYIIRKRMDKAVFLLKNSNLKIYEITAQLGYQNPQYFSKIFKRFYGLTPQEFRD